MFEEEPDELIRIGSKVVSRKKINLMVQEIMYWRSRGYSQDSVAEKLKIDRTFISRLEKAGEVKKGTRVAVVGFPLENKKELEALALQAGAEYVWLLNNRERWELIEGVSAMDFFNYTMEKINRLKEFDAVILLTSEKWYGIASALLDNRVIFFNLGSSPLKEDCWIDTAKFKDTLGTVLLVPGGFSE